MEEMMKNSLTKKLIMVIISTVILVCSLVGITGCGKKITKEDIAYETITYVAEHEGVKTKYVTLLSGSLKQEDNGDYLGYFVVRSMIYTLYYTGTYNPKTKEITYRDTTSIIEQSEQDFGVGAGPLYTTTDSFNIDKVNKRLHKYVDPNEVNFYDVYLSCDCYSRWADVYDASLRVDTNPSDYSSSSSLSTLWMDDVLASIKKIHTMLGIPSYVYDDMLATRAVDGHQNYSGTKVDVSWTYHPDRGLEVAYKAKV